jgi:hypothetical protein
MSVVTTADVRDYLVSYFDDKAAFREQMAERAGERNRPWDVSKNEAYALSLRRMARYVSTLPDDNPTLRTLAEHPDLYDQDAGFDIPSDPDGISSLSDQAAVHCGERGKAMESAELGEWFADWAAGLIALAPELRASREEHLREISE